MTPAGSWIKRKWHDPVWSKVIANAIWALPSLFLWSRSQFSLDPAIAFAAAGAFISTSWSWLTMPLSIPRIAVWLVLITAGSLALVVAWLVRNRFALADVEPSSKQLLVVAPPEPVAHTATEEQVMRFLAMRHEQSDRFPRVIVAQHLKLPKIVVDDAIASLRARNWLWDVGSSGAVMLSDVGKSIAVENRWHETPAELEVITQKALDSAQQKILQALHTKYALGMTATEIAKTVNQTHAATEMRLSQLDKLGLVEFVLSGPYSDNPNYWRLTEQGRDYGVSRGYDLI